MLINVINVNPEFEIMSLVKDGIQKSKEGRVKRILSVVEQSKKYGLEVKFWEGITKDKFQLVNINASHRQIVADAKKRKLRYVCIAEDDFLLSAPGAWEYFIENIPNDYDIYFGGVYSAQVKEGRILNGFSGMTLYIVHERFYDFFLNIDPKDHIDKALGTFAHKKMYRIVQPYVVYQMSGFSDNHRRETSHNAFLDDMKLFGRD